MNSKNSILHPCNINKCLTMDCCCNDSSGICLIVPVYIHKVCANKNILVIVEVYKNNHLYARQIKKIFTSHHIKCYENNNLIDRIYVGDFEFYFTDICEPSSICVDVKTQYIYD